MSHSEAAKVLEDKVALVTGASKGIGKALAIGLARHGAAVSVNYKNDRQGAEKTANVIREMGSKTVVIGADVSVIGDVTQLVNETVDRLGKIDVLVNNAAGHASTSRLRSRRTIGKT